jgi:hypothetical protein
MNTNEIGSEVDEEEEYLRLLAPEARASYEAFLAEMEADHERSIERRGQRPPQKWGEAMPPEDGKLGYFCEPCWYQGFLTGFHPDDSPPCDLVPRGPFDPR